jgi:hypothetical protein
MQRDLSLRRPTTAVLVAVTASLAIVACGGSSPKNSGSSANAATLRSEGLKFAACVRAHGVPDYPDPSTNGPGQIRATPNKMTVNGHTLSESPRLVQKAMQTCQKDAPEAKGPPVSAAQLAKLKAGALAMAKCMRANGVPNFPDPTIGTGPGGHGVSVGIIAGGPKSKNSGSASFNPRSPAFKAAQKKCQPLMTKVLPGLSGAKKG